VLITLVRNVEVVVLVVLYVAHGHYKCDVIHVPTQFISFVWRHKFAGMALISEHYRKLPMNTERQFPVSSLKGDPQ
jgi:hypothetical protein